MSRQSAGVKVWRKATKERMVTAMGGQCQCCGYNRCHSALEMHHIDPKEKDFSFGKVTANPKAWPAIVAELLKCVLLCSNCHREIHAGVRQVPEIRATFDTSYVEYRSEPKPRYVKKVGYDRRQPRHDLRKVDRPSKEGLTQMVWAKPLLQIGLDYGVSDNAIRKWCKTYGIELPPTGYHTRRQAGYSHDESMVSQKRVTHTKNWMTEEIAQRASVLRQAGQSYREIGATLGFGHWTIQQALRRYGFESHP